MCGICGIINYSDEAGIEREVIPRMCSRLKHRGPDDEGSYFFKGTPSLGLGHRRLSIIDLSSLGHQPMPNEDNTIWLIFNGEIYNYPELRSFLQEKGHSFRSNTDTETLIHLYEEHGLEDSIKLLRGMFAFALWDERDRLLVLARDRVGKKPLIYCPSEKFFCFSSEFDSLLASGLIKKKINHKAIDYYLTFGYIPAPFTIYEGVFKLPPAHFLTVKEGNVRLHEYWQLQYLPKLDICEEEASSEVLKLLRESVRIRLHSDVPLGAFLSGGIDSSTVVAMMCEASGKKVKTFSIGFNEQAYSELSYARAVARRFNTDHHEFVVKPDCLAVLPLLVERYGEPYADSSCIPTYYVAQQTKQYVTVALNGDGGDELFAGYERYQAMVLADRLDSLSDSGKAGMRFLSYLLPDSPDPKNTLRRLKRFLEAATLTSVSRYLRWVGIFNHELKRTLYSDNFFSSVSRADPSFFIRGYLNNGTLGLIDKLLLADTRTYLPSDLLVKADIATMSCSLEARSPFLDHRLMEFCARLPIRYKAKGYVKKYILKKAIKDIIPAKNIHRRKMGFGLPIGDWFRKELNGFLRDTLLSEASLKRGYFTKAAVNSLIEGHCQRGKDYTLQLWALLMLELWQKRFMDR